MLDVGAYGRPWRRRFSFRRHHFSGSRSELPDNPQRLSMYALPTGLSEEVPFFQFVNTYNQGRPESVGDS